jgi:hypothetical protein
MEMTKPRKKPDTAAGAPFDPAALGERAPLADVDELLRHMKRSPPPRSPSR